MIRCDHWWPWPWILRVANFPSICWLDTWTRQASAMIPLEAERVLFYDNPVGLGLMACPEANMRQCVLSWWTGSVLLSVMFHSRVLLEFNSQDGNVEVIAHFRRWPPSHTWVAKSRSSSVLQRRWRSISRLAARGETWEKVKMRKI